MTGSRKQNLNNNDVEIHLTSCTKKIKCLNTYKSLGYNLITGTVSQLPRKAVLNNNL